MKDQASKLREMAREDALAIKDAKIAKLEAEVIRMDDALTAALAWTTLHERFKQK